MANRFEDARDLVHECHSIPSGEVMLHVETLSAAVAADTIVLLSEAEAPSSRWPTALVSGLAREFGKCVWFDTRDCGASTWVDEPYSLDDLVDDAGAVIESVNDGAVTVLGRSMGGEIGMRLSLARPELVESLVLLSATPGRREELGLPEQWLIDNMVNRLFDDPPSDAESRQRWIVDQMEWFSGPVFAFDRAAVSERVGGEISTGWRGPNGHGRAVMEADDVVESLRNLKVPTTIVHGTSDPVLPLGHARALHALIEGSSLELIEGLGHELPEGFVGQLLGIVAAARR